MLIRNFAAIDVGSNAIRLLIMHIIENKDSAPSFRKYSLIRVPIRLGEDALLLKQVSEVNKARLIKTFDAFKNLMEVHGVEHYRACATSAMRNSSNNQEIVQQIKAQTGLLLEVISGSEEVALIAKNYSHLSTKKNNYLFVDVGGGSTEFTMLSNGQLITSKSFRIGTLSLLNNMVKKEDIAAVQKWVESTTRDYKNIIIMGSGGNINKIAKEARKKGCKELNYSFFKSNHSNLSSMSYEERVKKLALGPDRADVIIHASQIFLNVMRWSGAVKIDVQKMGLSDGIVKQLYDDVTYRNQY